MVGHRERCPGRCQAGQGPHLLPQSVRQLQAGPQPDYAGEPAILALREALAPLGYDLADDGTVRPRSMEGLSGDDMTVALRAYVQRARTAGDDSALRIGTAKELAEATARHVLVERVGSYPEHGSFPSTLMAAFGHLGLSQPSYNDIKAFLSGDAWESVERSLFLLACAVNRYRNEEGTGHGRPHPCLVGPEQGRLAAEASALVSEALLDGLE